MKFTGGNYNVRFTSPVGGRSLRANEAKITEGDVFCFLAGGPWGGSFRLVVSEVRFLLLFFNGGRDRGGVCYLCCG